MVIEGDLTIFDPLQPAGPEDTAAATDRLADAAPAEVAAEMRLLADTFAAVATVLDEVDPSDPEAADQIAALDIDEDEIAAAQAAVTGYALDECRHRPGRHQRRLGDHRAADDDARRRCPPTTLPPTTVPPASVVTTTVPPVTG